MQGTTIVVPYGLCKSYENKKTLLLKLNEGSYTMEWVLNLFSEYLENDFKKRLGVPKPTVDQLWDVFKVLFPTTTARLLVQEPVGNTVRFKLLAFYHADEMGPLIDDPMGYIKENFGGGKFKINFYQGMQFIATINFKPEGPEIWRDLLELEESEIQ